MKRSLKLAVLTLGLTLVTTSMFAGTIATAAGANNVTANVNGGCQWNTAFSMPFGAYDPFSGVALTKSATITFNCVKKTNATNAYLIYFDKTGGNMTDGTDSLGYTLKSGGSALPVGAGAAFTVVGTPGVGAGTGYSYTVDGTVTAGQNVEVGSYNDTVIVTVQY